MDFSVVFNLKKKNKTKLWPNSLITDHARQITKSMMRKQTVDKLMSNRESDTLGFVNFITKDSIQKSLGMYLAMLKKKKSK